MKKGKNKGKARLLNHHVKSSGVKVKCPISSSVILLYSY